MESLSKLAITSETPVLQTTTSPESDRLMQIRGCADKSLDRPGRKESTAKTSRFIKQTRYEAQCTS
jgi:hypothetical protein